MTQSEIEALEDGQTLWWLYPNLEKVQEATFVESETPRHMRRWDDGFRIKPRGEGMLFVNHTEVYATKKAAYWAALAKLGRIMEVATNRLNKARKSRDKIFYAALAEGLSP